VKKGGQGLLLLVVALSLAKLVLSFLGGKEDGAVTAAGDDAQSDTLRSLAVKLEEQGLSNAAADVWREYVNESAGSAEDQARIWYRIGTMEQAAGDHEAALSAFYRSEKLAPLSDIQSDIGRRVEDCLEGMGRFSALKQELAQRVGLGSQKGAVNGAVVAEIGPEKITVGQLDQLIESRVEQQLAMAGASMDKEQMRRQEEALMKQFATADQRRQFLLQWIAEEVLFRKAMKEELLKDDEVAASVQSIQRSQLASIYLQKMLKAAVHVGDSDVEDFYKANPDRFTRPRQVKLAQIVVEKKETAEDLMKKLGEGADFAKLAGEFSTDETTREKGGVIDGWIVAGGPIGKSGASPRAHELISQTAPGEVLPEVIESDAGFQVIKVLEEQPETLVPLEEARSMARQMLTRRRSGELQQALMEELKNEFDVVLHESVLGAEKK